MWGSGGQRKQITCDFLSILKVIEYLILSGLLQGRSNGQDFLMIRMIVQGLGGAACCLQLVLCCGTGNSSGGMVLGYATRALIKKSRHPSQGAGSRI
jgi:hypothetical protein